MSKPYIKNVESYDNLSKLCGKANTLNTLFEKSKRVYVVGVDHRTRCIVLYKNKQILGNPDDKYCLDTVIDREFFSRLYNDSRR